MQSMPGRNVLVLLAGAFALAHCGPGSMMPDVVTMEGGSDGSMMMDASPDTITQDTPAPEADAPPGMCGTMLGPCNPTTSEGCPSGQACYIVSSASGGAPTGMCGMPGPVAAGAPCASANACQMGLQCLNSVCTRMCCASGDTGRCRVAGGRDICVPLNLRGSTAMLFNCESTSSCDWFAQNCPMANQNCMPILSDGTSQCQPAGTGTAEMPCGGSTGVMCGRGLICAGFGADPPSCRRICNPLPGGHDAGVPDGGISMDCPMGQTCHPFDPARYPQNFGACGPMM